MEWHFYFSSLDLVLSSLIPTVRLLSSTKVSPPSLHYLAFVTFVCGASLLFAVCVCMIEEYVTKLVVCCLYSSPSSDLIGQSLL